MKILLTPDQESTIWHLTETIKTPNGDTFYHSPYYLKSLGNGEYERVTFDQLPEEARDMFLQKEGLKIPY